MRVKSKIMGAEKGFTLMEMIVVIGIIGILAGMAIPAFSSWLPNYRLRSAVQDLYSNLQLAKITAIKRNANCTVTFSVPVDGIKYDYIIYIEPKIVNYKYDEGDEILVMKRWTDYDENIGFDTSRGNNNNGLDFSLNANGQPTISFRPNGFPENKDKVPEGGSVFIKNNKNRSMSVVMTAAGSISID